MVKFKCFKHFLDERKFPDSLRLPNEVKFYKFLNPDELDNGIDPNDTKYAFTGRIARDSNSGYIVVTYSEEKGVNVGDEFHDVEFENYCIRIYTNNRKSKMPTYFYLNY